MVINEITQLMKVDLEMFNTNNNDISFRWEQENTHEK